MKLLFLAPEPFFQERGTPIAVRLALEVLATRVRADTSHRIDLLTYHEGEPIDIPGVSIHRIKAPSFLRNIGPGISWKKLLCDVIFLFTALRLVFAERRDQYDLVHAVEESVFIAWLIKLFFRIPYIYDMDSSLAMQVSEKWPLVRPLRPVLAWFERFAVKGSVAVVPVCDALAAIADAHGSKDITILRDVSLLDESHDHPKALREEIGAKPDAEIVLYIGNLEKYQGIDLLLESFSLAARVHHTSELVIIGGNNDHVAFYRERAKELGVERRAHFLGHRPVARLSEYITQADILASPRVKGNNTPMKVYSYLHSGKAILATNLETHTQVLSSQLSVLAAPDSKQFSDALVALLSDRELRMTIGANARNLAEREYTFQVFTRRLSDLYDRLTERLPHFQNSENPPLPAEKLQ